MKKPREITNELLTLVAERGVGCLWLCEIDSTPKAIAAELLQRREQDPETTRARTMRDDPRWTQLYVAALSTCVQGDIRESRVHTDAVTNAIALADAAYRAAGWKP